MLIIVPRRFDGDLVELLLLTNLSKHKHIGCHLAAGESLCRQFIAGADNIDTLGVLISLLKVLCCFLNTLGGSSGENSSPGSGQAMAALDVVFSLETLSWRTNFVSDCLWLLVGQVVAIILWCLGATPLLRKLSWFFIMSLLVACVSRSSICLVFVLLYPRSCLFSVFCGNAA
jgi:hypothetical protein